ncbi:hypothetical protein EVAR_54615_1 [Eumeta japonica]|uniref:Uncharacterized protein n=1 Tax=Eumeta variegata TaxID=151549 RepID=A0A4C1YM39_EUMVA|nr:hypothetical protein EVAR_54615_1 [Eumeta japonica]
MLEARNFPRILRTEGAEISPKLIETSVTTATRPVPFSLINNVIVTGNEPSDTSHVICRDGYDTHIHTRVSTMLSASWVEISKDLMEERMDDGMRGERGRVDGEKSGPQELPGRNATAEPVTTSTLCESMVFH